MHFLKSIFVLSALALLLAACSTTSTPEGNADAENSNAEAANAAPSPTVMDDLTAGKKHFATNCASCHQDDGTGGPVEVEGKKLKPEDLTTAKMAKEPDEEYMEYMKEGIPDEGMPAFEDVLSDAEMKQVVKYIREELQKQ